MTISSNTRRLRTVATGLTNTFNGPMVYKASDLVVTTQLGTLISQVPSSDYVVKNIGRSGGSKVVFNSAPASGTVVLIRRVVDFVQNTDVTNQGAFHAEVIEKGYDEIVFQTQQLADQQDLSLHYPDDYLGDPPNTELPVAESGRLLGWNLAGNGIVNYDLNPDGAGDLLLRSNLADPTGGGNLVGYKRLATGTVNRTVYEKLSDVVSVKDFGAKGDGATDDAAAFNKAFAAANSVYVPPGRYYINSNLVNINKVLDLFGDGISSSILVFGTSVTLGILHDATSIISPLFIRDIALKTLRTITSVQGAGAICVSAVWPETFLRRADFKSVIDNVQFGDSDPANAGWAQSLIFTQGQNVVVSNCIFTGQPTVDGAAATPSDKTRSSAGIVWQGGVYPTELKVTDCFFYNFYQAVLATGAPEGLYFKGVTCVDCGYGININVTTFSPGIGGGSAKFRPLLNIDGCHFSCWYTGVSADGFIQSMIHDNLFYASSNAGQNSVCLNINNAGSMHVHDNVFVQFTNGGFKAQGLVVNNANGVFISSNEFAVGFDECIRLGPGATNCRLFKNQFNGSVITADVVDNGPQNFTGSRGCLYSASSPPLIASGANTAVTWDTSSYDSDGIGATGTSALTIPAGRGIKRIRLTAGGIFTANATGIRDAYITKNGSAAYPGSAVVNQMTASGTAGSSFSLVSAIIPCTAGDVFNLSVFHNSGGNLTMVGGKTFLSLEVID